MFTKKKPLTFTKNAEPLKKTTKKSKKTKGKRPASFFADKAAAALAKK